jgi:hypothetical protein
MLSYFKSLKLSNEMIYAIILIIYISILSIYTPRSWLTLINHPYVKFAILLYILYVIVYDEDLVLGIFMIVAFILTITLDNSIQAAKVTYENDVIEPNKELFTSKKNNENEDEDDYVNDEEDEEKYQNMLTDKTLKDTFQNLHESIHELQKMVNENKNK